MLQYRFIPQTLVNCSKVCRVWYSIFYPALWTVYDGNAISSLDTSSAFCIPDDLVLAQSYNIRILLNDHRRLFGRRQYECPHLVDLTVYGSSPGTSYLIKSHGSQLKRLRWYGNMPFSGMMDVLDMTCIANLTNLEELMLIQWDVSSSDSGLSDENDADDKIEFVNLENKNENKDINRIQGFDDFPEDFLTFSNSKQQHLVLERLEELMIDAEWIENKALVYFLTGRHISLGNICPRPRRLDLGSGLLEDEDMIARLDETLPLTLPGLVKDTTLIENSFCARYQKIITQIA
ncbi:hypothetical protein FBU30_000980 [Linnemannia zychae]|nr:hypothetical protein FBU30_000980 [Linnemannia zychae]